MDADDWIDIAPAVGVQADNVRRADAKHPLDFYRGRDFAGRYIFSLAADAGCRDLPEPPKLNGIDVSLERSSFGGARLLLTLQDRDQFDIFRALCEHLLIATNDQRQGANAGGLRLVVRRLADWHDMLRGRRDSLLSTSERMGLIGELLFLRDVILPLMLAGDAVATWRGAHRDEQDFAIGHAQFEIKTQLSTSDQRLIISSEAQLDTAGSTLFLCHQVIANSPAIPGSFTLNSLVSALAKTFINSGPAVFDLFDVALQAWGYVRRDEYDLPCWVLTDRCLFEVRDGFPRIVPGMLPSGVQKVSYEVLLRECESFLVDLGQTVTRVVA